jgi:glycosyltransferase involved in cell wall biosynthesis
MKIVQVLHGFFFNDTATTEIYTYSLSRELAKQHEVHVFYRVEDVEQEEYATRSGTYDGLNTCTINNTFKHCTSFEQSYKNVAIAQRFGRFLDTVDPHIVHFGHLAGLSVTLIEEAKQRHIPVVFTLHDFWLFCQLGQLLKPDLSICRGPEDQECAKCLAPERAANSRLRMLFQLVRKAVPDFNKRTRLRKSLRAAYHRYALLASALRKDGAADIRARTKHINAMCALVDLFIAPSQFVRQRFIDFGISPAKLIHCEHGFQVTPFRGIERKPSPKLRFAYTGTFIPSKGVHVLLKAFDSIRSDDVELRLYGTDRQYHYGFEHYADHLRSLAQSANVDWCGSYENQHIGAILAETDVLIVPSIWYENSPLTIQEAFLAGVPVITSNIGGMAELVQHGVNGLLFRVGDHEDLAAQMRAISADPGILERLRRNIRPPVSIETHARRMEEIYNRAIEMAKAR